MRIYSVEYIEEGNEKKKWFSSRASASKGLTAVKREKIGAQVNPNIVEHDVEMNKAGLLGFLNSLTS